MVREKSNYKILDLVGRGQFGRVYAAIERRSGNLVALKELNIKQLSTSSFLRELTFLVTLDHFNIVTCQALEHKQNKRYLVMDYCEGGTLRDLMDRLPRLSLTQSLQLVIDILQGLEFAHNRGIIHRDIKPENILLKSSDCGYTAHIADFGIAQLNQQAEINGVLGNTGSPAYMAPEQFYGDYSYNCDLYGLGIILYELVVGERPFLGMPKDLLAAHLSQPAIVPDNVPLILRSVIDKALRKFPQYRFQNAAEMLQSLQLAREIIESEDRTATPIQSVFNPIILTADLQMDFDEKILHLATAAGQVYLGTNSTLVRCNSDAELSTEILESARTTFDEPIRNLQPNASGCLVTTNSSLYYQSCTEEIDTGFLSIATFDTERVIATVDPEGSWLTTSYQTQYQAEAKFNIYQLPQGKLKRSLANCFFDRLIALDSRHALGTIDRDRSTKFQLFNRRGNWLAKFTVRVRLATVVYNPLFSDCLLATEVNNPRVVVLIKLRKFNLKRIWLEIQPALITACSLGYLLCDRQGRAIVLSADGDSMSRFKFSLASEFEVMAIAASDSRLFVASASATQSQVQAFTWKKIAALST